MLTYDCDCKNIIITEGIFGEIYEEYLEKKVQYENHYMRDQYNDSEEYGEEYKPESYPYVDIEGVPDVSKLIQVKSYKMVNRNRVEVLVIAWGATIVSLKYPDKYGYINDVVLGFDDLKSYMNPNINPFIGCILGRCANRIKNGEVVIKGKTYQLTRNENNNHLHGGTKGFGRRLWESYVDGCSVVMSYLSEDGEEGYPGTILSTVRFKLTPDNKLEIGIRATTTNSTIVNISHGSLFNLAGHDAGEKELMKHEISLNCDRWTFANYADGIPTGSIRGVGGTVMDLRIPKILESCIKKIPLGEGYDHNFCITSNWHGNSTYVARAVHPRNGRVLEIYSDQPGVQFYTGGRLPSHENDDINDDIKYNNNKYNNNKCNNNKYVINGTSIMGKRGARYVKNCAFSIQPQNYPNAINTPHFPCSILQPGQVYCHDLIYKFGNQLNNYM